MFHDASILSTKVLLERTRHRHTPGLMTRNDKGSMLNRRRFGESHAHCPGKCSSHFNKVTLVATPCRTNCTNRVATEASEPLEGVFQMTSMPTSWTPDKDTLHWLVTNEAHGNATPTILTNLPRSFGGTSIAHGSIRGGVERLSASRTRFVYSKRRIEA